MFYFPKFFTPSSKVVKKQCTIGHRRVAYCAADSWSSLMAFSVLKKLPCTHAHFFIQIIVHFWVAPNGLSVTWNSNFELTLMYVKMFNQRGMASKDTTTAWVKVYILCWVTSICISIHTNKSLEDLNKFCPKILWQYRGTIKLKCIFAELFAICCSTEYFSAGEPLKYPGANIVHRIILDHYIDFRLNTITLHM